MVPPAKSARQGALATIVGPEGERLILFILAERKIVNCGIICHPAQRTIAASGASKHYDQRIATHAGNALQSTFR